MSSLVDHLITLSVERQHYLLQNLVSHAADAKQYERLRSLFADDAWMHARVKCAGYIYSGFLDDIEIGWKTFTDTAAESTSNKHNILTDYVRLGLISSSITSQASIPINLLVNVASTGAWTIERVLATIARYPSIVERLVVYNGLLMIEHLDGGVRGQIQQLVRDNVANSPTLIPVRFLTRILPSLSGAVFDYMLEHIISQIIVTPLSQTQTGWGDTQFTQEDPNIYIDEVLTLLKHVPTHLRLPLIERVAQEVFKHLQRITGEMKLLQKERKPKSDQYKQQHFFRQIIKDRLEQQRQAGVDPIYQARVAEQLFRSLENEGQPDQTDSIWDATLTLKIESLRYESNDLELLGQQLQQIAQYVTEADSADVILGYIVKALEMTDDSSFHRVVIPAFAAKLPEPLLERVVHRTLSLNDGTVLRARFETILATRNNLWHRFCFLNGMLAYGKYLELFCSLYDE